MSAFEVQVPLANTIEAQLNQLAARTGNVAPALKVIGEQLMSSTKRRFSTSTAPDGSRWAPNARSTLEIFAGSRKSFTTKSGRLSAQGIERVAGKKPLVNSGQLGLNIKYQVTGNTLSVGTPEPYGAIQQFGGKQGQSGKTKRGGPIPFGDIPARPFLGLSKADETFIEQTLEDFITGDL